MHLTDHTDFGLRLLMTLGARAPGRISARELAEAHGISFSHVQKVVQSLESEGFVETFRGRGGGVTLARAPDEITIGEVVRALEPHLHLVRCFQPGESGCVLAGGCALTGVLKRARSAFMRELDEATLGELLTRSPYAFTVIGGAAR